MIAGLRNMQAAASRVREVGPHQHQWVVVGQDGQGETYRQCSVCDARSCIGPRPEAQRQDWLGYREDWAATPDLTADPEPEVPAKRPPGRPRKSK